MPVRFNRAGIRILIGGPALQGDIQPLMQFHSPEELPFLCIPGVKEYHDHPGHSGDPWEIHRPSGEGRLVQLLEVISKYGLEPVSGLNIEMTPKISFALSEIPQ